MKSNHLSKQKIESIKTLTPDKKTTVTNNDRLNLPLSPLLTSIDLKEKNNLLRINIPNHQKYHIKSLNNKLYPQQKKINRLNKDKIIINQEIGIEELESESESDHEDHKGIWIGHCCFIQYGNNKRKSISEIRPPPPLPPRYTRDDYYNNFCCCCFGRRLWVFTIFLIVLFLTILVFFFWPRLPLIRVEGAINTVPTKVTQTQQGDKITNVAFETTWLLNITMDNRRNYFTTRFNKIQIIVKDALTGLLIGKGNNENRNEYENNSSNNNDLDSIYLPGYTISTIQLPIAVSYQARDNSDTTFSNLIRACVYHNNMTMFTSTTTNDTIYNLHNNNSINSTKLNHHSLSIQFWFNLYIFGLDWIGYKPTVIATPATGGFSCPS